MRKTCQRVGDDKEFGLGVPILLVSAEVYDLWKEALGVVPDRGEEVGTYTLNNERFTNRRVATLDDGTPVPVGTLLYVRGYALLREPPAQVWGSAFTEDAEDWGTFLDPSPPRQTKG